MRPFNACLTALIFAGSSLLLASSAKADTFRIVTLGTDNSTFFRGIDASGNVVISYNLGPSHTTCDPGTRACFKTFVDGQLAATDFSLPLFTPDNGTPCAPAAPAGARVLQAICNNGREAFTGYLSLDQGAPSLYAGPDLTVLSRQANGSFLFMNSGGDLVWNDPNAELWFEAFNVTPTATSTVPEPGTLVLLTTGTIASLTTLRRRWAS